MASVLNLVNQVKNKVNFAKPFCAFSHRPNILGLSKSTLTSNCSYVTQENPLIRFCKIISFFSSSADGWQNTLKNERVEGNLMDEFKSQM